MKEIEFRIPPNCDLTKAERLIERVCEDCGLHPAMKGSLAKYPRCTHWHYKKDQQSGTLELTLYVPGRRIWAKVQAGRQASWIDLELTQVRHGIESALRSTPSKRQDLSNS
jgi:hypothetical protein